MIGLGRGITMLKVKIPAYESYRIGVRPAVLTSLRQMLEYFDIGTEHKVFFNGEAEVSKLLGGEYNGRRGDDRNTDLGFDNKIFVELERDLAGYNDELDSLTNNDTVPCMWYNELTGAKITPKFNTRKMIVTVNQYYKDRTSAQRNYNALRAQALGTHHNSLFSVETHFPLTNPALNCYKEIFDRLVNAKQVPADKDFIDWMMENATVPTGIIRNLIGNNPAFVFKQCIDEIGINLENPRMAYVNKGTYMGKYEISWSYWFYWSEHTEWIFQYPIQIFQQQMSDEYIPENFMPTKQDYATRRFFESAAAQVVWDVNKNKEPFYHVLPEQDNWRPEPEYWISPQLQVMINVEDVQDQVLLNITDIQGFEWNPVVLNYILRYHEKVTDRHRNPMQFKVWSDETQVLEEQIVLDANGDLRITRPPRMASTYRITFNFDYALRLYSEECIVDLTADPEYGRWIIDLLFPQYPLPDNWGEGGYWDWWDVHNGVEVGDGDEVHPYPNGMLGHLIIAHNEETYGQYKSLIDKGTIDGTNYYRENTSATKG